MMALVVLIAVGALLTLGQTNQATLNNVNQNLSDSKIDQLTGLLSKPSQATTAPPNQPSAFAFVGTNGQYTFSVDPKTGYYDMANGNNSTAAEGDTQAMHFSREAVAMLEALAKTGRLPDGTPLSEKEKTALANMAQAGYGLTGAQLWLGATQEDIKAAGIMPSWGGWTDSNQNGAVTDGSYMAWAFSHGPKGQDGFDIGNDDVLMQGLLSRYDTFQSAYGDLNAAMQDNPALQNIVKPVVGAIDQVTRNNFYLDPANLGNNASALAMVEKNLPPPLDIKGTVNTSQVKNTQAIEYTYTSSAKFDQTVGSKSIPTLDDIYNKN